MVNIPHTHKGKRLMNIFDLATMTDAQFSDLIYDDPVAPIAVAVAIAPLAPLAPLALYHLPGVRNANDALDMGDLTEASDEQIASWLARALEIVRPLIALANKQDRTTKITIEIVGVWAWVQGTNYADTELRSALKIAGFRWASKRKMWSLATVPSGGRGKKGYGALCDKYGAYSIAAD